MATNGFDDIDRPLIPPTADQLAAKVVPLRVVWDADASLGPAMAYPTLQELWAYAGRHGIPVDACRIEYSGCSTHGFELDWRDR